MVRLYAHGALLLTARLQLSLRQQVWRIGRDGAVEPSFPLGDAIQDVLILDNQIIVTYFDEGALGGSFPSSEGVASFAEDGAVVFGYANSFGYEEAVLYDVYAAALLSDRRIAICPYGDKPSFPLILVDLASETREVIPTPEELHGSRAITVDGEQALFWHPYNDKTGIYHWRIGSEDHERVDEHDGPLRGLSDGRFLAVRPDGYSILAP
jgi:hypothetical protein